MQIIAGNKRREFSFSSRYVSAGTLGRRYAGYGHDSNGVREAIEGVAAGHQAGGEMPRRTQTGSGERRKENRTEQDAAGVTRGASAGATEKTEATAGTSGRRGESQSREEILGRLEVAERLAERLAGRASRITRVRECEDNVRELRVVVVAEKRQRIEPGQPERFAGADEIEAGNRDGELDRECFRLAEPRASIDP